MLQFFQLQVFFVDYGFHFSNDVLEKFLRNTLRRLVEGFSGVTLILDGDF